MLPARTTAHLPGNIKATFTNGPIVSVSHAPAVGMPPALDMTYASHRTVHTVQLLARQMALLACGVSLKKCRRSMEVITGT